MTTTTYTFPHGTLTPIVGKPALATLTLLKRELYANAMFKKTTQGGGRHGYLALVMSTAEYALLPGTIPFIEPASPGVQAAHGATATAPQMTEANRRHDYSVTQFNEYWDIHGQLKLQIIKAVHATYIEILNDPIYGLANVSVHDLLKHLMDTYGTLTTEDLENNRNKIMADWNPDTGIEHLWTRAAACKKFAEGTNLSLSDDAIMHLLLVPIEKTKVFEDDIKAWRILPTAAQTWDAFKEHFETRNKERTRKRSMGTAGYNALAAVTAGLTIQQPETASTPAGNTAHSANAAASTPVTATNRRNNAALPAIATLMDDAGAPVIKLYYCHSCGLTQFKSHTSISCNRPKPGHKTEATARNMMNGSTTFAIRARTTGSRTTTPGAPAATSSTPLG